MAGQAPGERITARDLLRGFLELLRLSPNLDTWTEERLANNPPRLFRLRQLVALSRAYRIAWDPNTFAEGGFIEPSHPRYDALVLKLATELPAGATFREHVTRDQLRSCFEILFRYRRQVDALLAFNAGVFEASGLYLYAHQRAEKFNKRLEAYRSVIEDPLVAMISPEGTAFSRQRLVHDYDYPDVGLSTLDDDWF